MAEVEAFVLDLVLDGCSEFIVLNKRDKDLRYLYNVLSVVNYELMKIVII